MRTMCFAKPSSHLRWLKGLILEFFNTDPGFGFILSDDGSPDVFVHLHEVEAAEMKTLVGGQVLVYNTAPARDGRLRTGFAQCFCLLDGLFDKYRDLAVFTRDDAAAVVQRHFIASVSFSLLRPCQPWSRHASQWALVYPWSYLGRFGALFLH
jgi:CspA family cold shock protein